MFNGFKRIIGRLTDEVLTILSPLEVLELTLTLFYQELG